MPSTRATKGLEGVLRIAIKKIKSHYFSFSFFEKISSQQLGVEYEKKINR